jgi:hypothetical protein
MNRKPKIGLLVLGTVFLIAVVLFFPYNAGSVPEWKLRVVETSGKPIAGAQVKQQWLDPINERRIILDSRITDADGWVLFPKRSFHDRLILRYWPKPHIYWPNAHIYACWKGQSDQVLFGELFYEDWNSEIASQLVVRDGLLACRYE